MGLGTLKARCARQWLECKAMKKAIEQMRKEGCAVVVLTPKELKGLNPSLLETFIYLGVDRALNNNTFARADISDEIKAHALASVELYEQEE